MMLEEARLVKDRLISRRTGSETLMGNNRFRAESRSTCKLG